jgi:6-pyruvoyltetrahydropterin/6-carboxytetrahydropterin synthase
MYKITKEFSCCSSHVLTGLPNTHPCSHLHGHNYVIKIELSSFTLDEVGFVYDYRGLDNIKKWIDETMDHKHLNDVFDFNPTAENIAKHIFEQVRFLVPEVAVSAVEVSETQKTNARFEA